MKKIFPLLLVLLAASCHAQTENGRIQTSVPVAGIDRIKPPAHVNNGTLCFASFWGLDTNDGLSWGSAKNSIMACYDLLNANQGGTIFFSDGGRANPVNACPTIDPVGCGIWLMGATDPNYAKPPAGWRRALKLVNFIGVGGSCFAANAHMNPRVCVAAGSKADRNRPAIWISGAPGLQTFYNMAFRYVARPIVLGIASNNDRNGAGGTSNISLVNMSALTSNTTGSGPGIDIGSNTFWIWIRDSLLDSTNTADSVKADNRAAVLINPGTGGGSGLIYIEDTNTNNGGVKIYTGRVTPTINVVVRNMTEEGDFAHAIPPPVWITNTGGCTFGNQILVDNVNLADPGPTPPPSVQNDCPATPDGLVLLQEGGASTGPATILGGYAPLIRNASQSAASQGSQGFLNGHVVGQHDASRRVFGPSVVRFPNIAPQVSGTWKANGGTGTVKSGVAAPDGTTGAARATLHGPGTGQLNFVAFGTIPLSVGDYLVGGAWLRSASGGGYAGSPDMGLNITFQVCTPITLSQAHGGEEAGDGNWQWQWMVKKITGGKNLGNCQPCFAANFDERHSIEAYAPVFFRIPVGTISENEVYDLALNLQSYPDAALAGDVSMLRGQRLNLMGNSMVLGGEALSSSPRSVMTAFLPGALSAPFTGMSWTPDKAITVTRVQVQARVAPTGCSKNAVVRLSDGSTSLDVTISSKANDSGVITKNYAAGSILKIGVQTAAAGCTTNPGDANVVVQYKTQ